MYIDEVNPFGSIHSDVLLLWLEKGVTGNTRSTNQPEIIPCESEGGIVFIRTSVAVGVTEG